VDANDRLRRYLEQRRELGESELVLDALPVEDVLAMLGAKGASSRNSVQQSRDAATHRASSLPPVSAPPAAAPAPVTAPPPEPQTRFDSTASTNWRDVLGAASNAPAPPLAPKTAAAASQEPASPASVSPASASPVPSSPVSSGSLPAWLTALSLPTGITVGSESLVDVAAPHALATLDDVANAARACTACALHATATNAVPGEGNPLAEFVCVGEAPGANEDLQGRPFVGDAGQLLTKILGAIQLSRDDVYICNVLKHRPPGNRDPLPEEVHACQPFLMRQLTIIRPRVILALGRFAAQTLLNTTTPIGKMRGQLHRFHGIPLIVTYHPAALLRNEAWKRPTWEDVKLARRVLDAARANASV